MGLASEVVDDAEVEPRALQLANQLAALPPTAVRFIKEAVLQGMNLDLDAGLQFERKSFQLLFSTAGSRGASAATAADGVIAVQPEIVSS